MFVALPDRQMNSLGEGRVVGNFVVNNFVTSNFIKMKSSENHLPPKTPPNKTQNFYMPSPHVNFSPFSV